MLRSLDLWVRKAVDCCGENIMGASWEGLEDKSTEVNIIENYFVCFIKE